MSVCYSIMNGASKYTRTQGHIETCDPCTQSLMTSIYAKKETQFLSEDPTQMFHTQSLSYFHLKAFYSYISAEAMKRNTTVGLP